MKTYLFVLVFYLSQSSAFAQSIISNELKVPIQNALNTSYEITNKQLEAHKTEINAESVLAKLKPEISANAVLSHFYQRGIIDVPTVTLPITGLNLFEGSQSFSANGNIGTVGISATQIIFSGNQIPNAAKALKEKAEAQHLLAEADKDAIAKEVVTTFDQLMLLKEAEKLIWDTQKRLDKESEKVKKAIINGLAIPYDRDKIALALLELEAKKVEIVGNRKLLNQRLTQLTHIDNSQISNIQYPLETIVIFDVDSTTQNRKELKALIHSSKALDYMRKKEKNSGLPSVFAFGNISYMNIFNSKITFKDVANLNDVHLKLDQFSVAPNILFGIGAKWTIYAGGEHKHKVELVKIDQEINENKTKDTDEKLKLLIQKSKIEYENAFEKLKISHQQVTISNNNKLLATKQYAEGLISVTERLEAENDFFKASLNHIININSQRKTALDLLQANGTLLTKILN
ncbi:transporter [Flavobacterium psychrophilum]|uniref:Probable outer membrane efflux protein n=2 Tax=Flavobacterium psychrophilum TaxID=96345 RepID=A6GWD7_FLAPJ|nr:TolC family protein [Flavobacterium psychrophilum]AIG29218.1 transporter [Flavobacterium psychrophilum]AIG31494.1 transporter [Flavobacterium psychrophilum]AIG33651.1 transporter [Flavobacterium psychrophilum]AIG36010.1 transporter [Flavobacterium psychrophilum]AIG38275.1 transporter [Flavobacterium psychrophilum]